MRCGLSGAALIEQDGAVVRGIEVTSVSQEISSIDQEFLGMQSAPVFIANSSPWSAVKEDNGNAVCIAAFFVVN